MLKKIVKFVMGCILILTILAFFGYGVYGVIYVLLGYGIDGIEMLSIGASLIASGIFSLIFYKIIK